MTRLDAPATIRVHVPAAPVLALLVVASALAVDPGGYAPYGPLRWVLVSTLALVAAARAFRMPWRVHRWSMVAWAGFLTWGAMAAVFAVDPLHAWIGTPDRRLGWMAWAVLGVIFLVAQSCSGPSDRRLLARAAVVAGIGIALVATLEWLGLLSPAASPGEAGRLVGPLGSAAYLGAVLTLLIPLNAAAAADVSQGLGWRVLAGASASSGVAVMMGSGTRGAWVGLLAGAVVSAPAWWGWLRRRPGPAVVAALAAVAVTALLVAATPVGEQVAGAVDPDDGGARARFDEWRIGAAASARYPLIGVGFEGYRVVFPDVVDADYVREHGRTVAPDRAHNGGLDVAVTTGLPGLVLYLAGAAWLAVAAVRGARSGDAVLAGAGAAVTGYLVQQQFLFPLAEVDPIFWVCAGVLVTGGPGRRVTIPAARWPQIACLVLAVVVGAVGVLDVAADRQAASALNLSAAGRHQAALASADTASALRPDSIRYRLVAAAMAAAAGDPAGYAAAVDRIDSALDLSPGDPILQARRADLLLEAAEATGDPATLGVALDAWESVVAADPFNGGSLLQLGVARAMVGDIAGAEEAWLAAEDLAPASTAPARNLAVLYLETGRREQAAAAVARALAVDPDDPTLVELAGRIRSEVP